MVKDGVGNGVDDGVESSADRVVVSFGVRVGWDDREDIILDLYYLFRYAPQLCSALLCSTLLSSARTYGCMDDGWDTQLALLSIYFLTRDSSQTHSDLYVIAILPYRSHNRC